MTLEWSRYSVTNNPLSSFILLWFCLKHGELINRKSSKKYKINRFFFSKYQIHVYVTSWRNRNSDVFNTLDEIYLVFTLKNSILFILFSKAEEPLPTDHRKSWNLKPLLVMFHLCGCVTGDKGFWDCIDLTETRWDANKLCSPRSESIENRWPSKKYDSNYLELLRFSAPQTSQLEITCFATY